MVGHQEGGATLWSGLGGLSHTGPAEVHAEDGGGVV